MTIASLGWFQIANRPTFEYIFGRDFTSPPQIERNRELITETVLRFVAVRPGEDDDPGRREVDALVSATTGEASATK
jgi:hypothetical protein